MHSFLQPVDATSIYHVGRHMRPADRAEVWAATGQGAVEALWRSVGVSQRAYIIKPPGQDAIAVCGVAPYPEGDMCVGWMVGTDDLLHYRREFIRASKSAFDDLGTGYSVMTNCVDERNTLHIRWLQYCGATFIKRFPSFGHEGRPFIQFVRLLHNV